MSTQLLFQVVGWFSLPVLAILAGTLLWRRIPRVFPHFFNYIVLTGVVGLVRLWAYHVKPQWYAAVYWISDVLIAMFAFLVTYELFIKRLFPRFYAVRFYQFLFPTAGMIITFLAVPAALQTRNISILLAIIHVFDVLRVTLLFFFIGLMAFMGRQWTRYELGITMGLVIEASGLLITSAIWSHQPWVRHLLDQLPVVTYDAACTVWLITFIRAEKTNSLSNLPLSSASSELVKEARKWEETMKDSFAGKKRSE
jgi:hypothetical protein